VAGDTQGTSLYQWKQSTYLSSPQHCCMYPWVSHVSNLRMQYCFWIKVSSCYHTVLNSGLSGWYKHKAVPATLLDDVDVVSGTQATLLDDVAIALGCPSHTILCCCCCLWQPKPHHLTQ